ncbi:hypothetical protein QR98_0049610, partial [Sarcoptes scabiei]
TIQTIQGQSYYGAYDFGQNRDGERRGELGPAAIAGITIGAMAILVALVVTLYFCYYTTVNSDNVEDQYPNTKYRTAHHVEA